MLVVTIPALSSGLLINLEPVSCSIYFDQEKRSSHRTTPDDNTWTSTIPAQLKAGQYVSGVQLREGVLFLLMFPHSWSGTRCAYHQYIEVLLPFSYSMLNSVSPFTLKRRSFIPVARESSCIILTSPGASSSDNLYLHSQVRVTGSGTDTPSDSDLVSMVDVYRDVQWPFIYGDFGTFTIPGPAPVTFGDNSGASTTPRPSTVASSSASTPTSSGISGGQPSSNASTVASQPATTSVHCHLKSRMLVRRRFARSH